MPHDRPPAAASPDPIPWEALERLSADELTPDEATKLRVRIDTNPAWQAALAQVMAVQASLDALSLQPMPLGLLRGVMHAVERPARPRLRWPQIAAGWAALVLLSMGAWFAASGSAPELVHGAPPAAWVAVADAPEWTADDGDTLWRPSLPLLAGSGTREAAWPWLLGGLLLLGVGIANGIRMHRRALGSGRTA